MRLLPGSFFDAQEANRALLHRLAADRLFHVFRVNAGLPSAAQPLGGWEKPDCELRGHFVGHFLSGCALMYGATGDQELRAKGSYLVSELAKCQQKLGGGYLSAFPLELFDRLKARKKVWAPFYTVHKIMAGMLDMYQYCGDETALTVARGMASWADKWTAGISDDQMQMVLDTEYGGMNEVFYNLAAVTRDDHYAAVGDRFTKRRFFDPLALHRDQLRGLHANTHIPQVIGAARRFELSGDPRFREVASYFWSEIVSSRSYVTGGTSNNEGWLVEANQTFRELGLGTDTNECCCAYNMMKLTRHLYTWTGDPRYFDYYERALYNHRLGTIDLKTGLTQYYLGVAPGSWRTFATADDSFWCCTGTGVEEYGKLNDSIYFYDEAGLYINLFIPSTLNWTERGIQLRQTNQFPETAGTRLEISAERPTRLALHIRVPSWVADIPAIRVNGKPAEVSAAGGSYVTILRTWSNQDSVEVTLPMKLRMESMPDNRQVQAIAYGPLALAAQLGSEGLTREAVIGPMGPKLKKPLSPAPSLKASNADPNAWIRPLDTPLSFHATGQPGQDVQLVPFHQVQGERYTLYWTVT